MVNGVQRAMRFNDFRKSFLKGTTFLIYRPTENDMKVIFNEIDRTNRKYITNKDYFAFIYKWFGVGVNNYANFAVKPQPIALSKDEQ